MCQPLVGVITVVFNTYWPPTFPCNTVNVLKFRTFYLFQFSNKKLVFRAGIHKMLVRIKQGRPWLDCFFRSSLIWVCTVSLICFGRQLLFEILEHLLKLNSWYAGNFFMIFVACWYFVSKLSVLKIYFRNTIRVSNCSDPDHAWQSVRPTLEYKLTVCKGYISAEVKRYLWQVLKREVKTEITIYKIYFWCSFYCIHKDSHFTSYNLSRLQPCVGILITYILCKWLATALLESVVGEINCITTSWSYIFSIIFMKFHS